LAQKSRSKLRPERATLSAMETAEIELTLFAEPSDGPTYEEDRRKLAAALTQIGGRDGRVLDKFMGAPPDFYVQLAAMVGPTVGTALGAWLHARYGRKIRVKIGDVEAEAQTVAEVARLLEKAQQIQQRNEPKKIYQP
jgi:hypothetical protein